MAELGEAASKPGGKPLFYQAKPVPCHLKDLILVCQLGRLDIVQELWREEWLPELHALKREDTCHPLLNAVHHLRPDVVEWLCEQGLSPFRPGTVHPYTGDGMVVTELQGISPMALIDKLSFLHPRRSKRRQLIEEVKEVLMRSVAKRGAAPAAQPVSPTVPEGPLLAASVPVLPSDVNATPTGPRREPDVEPPSPVQAPAAGGKKRKAVEGGELEEEVEGEGEASKVVLVPPPARRLPPRSRHTPPRSSPGRARAASRVPVFANDESEEEEEGETGALDACPPTAVIGFGAVGPAPASILVSATRSQVPSLPTDVPVPPGAAVGTVIVPDSVSVPHLLLRVLQTVCDKERPCDFGDLLASVESFMASSVRVPPEHGDELASPPRLPRVHRSWSSVLPLIPDLIRAVPAPRNPVSVSHTHVCALGPPSSASGLRGVDVGAGLVVGDGEEEEDMLPYSLYAVSFDAGLGGCGDQGGFVLYVRGGVMPHRWAYQLCSAGLSRRSGSLYHCPPFLSWERAMALHIDQVLTSLASTAPGRSLSSSVAHVSPHGCVKPTGRALHVGRPSVVRFLSCFDDGADADYEALSDVTNAARRQWVNHSPPLPFDRVVIWVDARPIQAVNPKGVSSIVFRHLTAVSGSVTFSPTCTVVVVIRCCHPAPPSLPLQYCVAYIDALDTASSLHDKSVVTGDGAAWVTAVSLESVCLVPHHCDAPNEVAFSLRLSLLAPV